MEAEESPRIVQIDLQGQREISQPAPMTVVELSGAPHADLDPRVGGFGHPDLVGALPPLGNIHQAGIRVAHHRSEAEFGDSLDRACRVGTVGGDIPQTDGQVDAALLHVGDDGLQCHGVAMDVRDQAEAHDHIIPRPSAPSVGRNPGCLGPSAPTLEHTPGRPRMGLPRRRVSR